MGTMNNCVALNKDLDDGDAFDVVDRAADYERAGLDPVRAAAKAVDDIMAQVKDDRAKLMDTIKEQQPDLHAKLSGEQPAAKAEQPAPAATPKPKKKAEPKFRNLLYELKKAGGLSRELAKELGGENATRMNRIMPGLFKENARFKAEDDIAEWMMENGWHFDAGFDRGEISTDAARAAYDMVSDALQGNKPMHPDDLAAYEAREQQMREAAELEGIEKLTKAQEEMGRTADDFAEVMGDDALDALMKKHHNGDSLNVLEFTKEAKGILDAELGREESAEGQQGYEAAGRQTDSDGVATEGDAAGRPEFDLNSPTEGEIRGRQEQQARSEQEQRQREQAPDSADFQLTGSDRPADAAGQNDIFGNSPQPKNGEAVKRSASQDPWNQTGNLYSFPANLFDPKLWKDVWRGSGLDGALLDHFGRTAADKKIAADKGKAFGSMFGRSVWDTMGSVSNTLAQRSGSKTAQDFIRRIAPKSTDLRHQGRQGYEHAAEYEFNERFNSMDKQWNGLDAHIDSHAKANDMGAKDKAAYADAMWKQVAAQVRNPQNIKAGTPVGDAALAIKKMFDDSLQYMRDAGLDVGEVKKGYYPREFDTDSVVLNTGKFIDGLVHEYGRNGIPKDVATKMATEVAESITTGRRSLFSTEGGGKPSGNFLKERVFRPDAESGPLKDFLVSDPRRSIPSYIQRMTRRAELSRLLRDMSDEIAVDVKKNGGSNEIKALIAAMPNVGDGDNAARWNVIVRKMTDDGVHGEVIDNFTDLLQTSAGIAGNKSRGLMVAAGWMKTLTAVALLEKAQLSSLTEPLVAGARTGNAGDILRAYATTASVLRNHVLPMWKSKNSEALEDLAKDIGILQSIQSDIAMANRWGGGNAATVKQSRIMDRAFKMTGLTQWTDATRVGSVRVGQAFAQRMAERVVAGRKGIAHIDALRELGIPKEKVDAFSQWLMNTNKGQPTLTDLRTAPKDMAALYKQVLRTFDNQTIMRPTKAMRPRWANNEVGSIFFQLQSYNYAMLDGVIRPQAKRLGLVSKALASKVTAGAVEMPKNAEGQSYTGGDALSLAGSLPAMILLPMMAGVINEMRDALMGDPDKEKELDTKILAALSRGLPIAPVDPLLNMTTGAKYGRSATEVFAGPGFGMVGRMLDAGIKLGVNNSENTNTAERNATKAAYDVLIEPAAAVGMAQMFGNATIPWKIAIAAGRQAVGSGQVRNELVDEVAGEKEDKNSGW
jgi:hypothetical protein